MDAIIFVFCFIFVGIFGSKGMIFEGSYMDRTVTIQLAKGVVFEYEHIISIHVQRLMACMQVPQLGGCM